MLLSRRLRLVRRGVSLDVAALPDSDGSQDGDEHMIQPTRAQRGAWTRSRSLDTGDMRTNLEWPGQAMNRHEWRCGDAVEASTRSVQASTPRVRHHQAA